MLWHMLSEKTTRDPSLWGLATVALGLVVYFLSGKMVGRDRRARR
jgi:APA family basic amino acid/polyamine antiporter